MPLKYASRDLLQVGIFSMQSGPCILFSRAGPQLECCGQSWGNGAEEAVSN